MTTMRDFEELDPFNPNEWLYEGLIRSYNNKVADLIRKLGINVRQYSPMQLEFEQNLTKAQAKDLKQILTVSGWYVSSPKDSKNLDPDWWFNSEYYLDGNEGFLLEPKYDSVSEEQLPEKLFHASPVEFRDKIEIYGLRPKSGSKIAFHPERIYFTTSEYDCKRYIEMICIKYNKNKEDFDIWSVDRKAVSARNVHIDPNFPTGEHSWSKLQSAAIFILEPITRYGVFPVKMGKNYEAAMERKRLEIEEKKKQRELQRLRELSQN